MIYRILCFFGWHSPVDTGWVRWLRPTHKYECDYCGKQLKEGVK